MTLSERVLMRSFAGATEWLNSEPLGAAELEGHNGVLRDGRLYQLVRQHDAVRQRTSDITFLEPGAEAYALTFG
jgi:hypothetical protein